MRKARRGWTMPEQDARSMLTMIEERIRSSDIQVEHRDALTRLRAMIEDDLEESARGRLQAGLHRRAQWRAASIRFDKYFQIEVSSFRALPRPDICLAGSPIPRAGGERSSFAGRRRKDRPRSQTSGVLIGQQLSIRQVDPKRPSCRVAAVAASGAAGLPRFGSPAPTARLHLQACPAHGQGGQDREESRSCRSPP
jgi:hypothetical protein